ncbi:hypothetical protein [Nocardia xishanensis]
MGDQDKPPALPVPGLQDLLDQQNVQAAVQKSADSQSRARRDDTELTDLGAGSDPDYVVNEEHFEGMTLEAMYAAVHGAAGQGGLDAAGLQTMRATWFDCFSELANLSTFNTMGLNRIFGNGLWQGASATAAQNASQQYSAVANQIGRVFETMSQRLDSLAWAAEAVKIAVPAPPSSVVVVPDPDNPLESVLPGLINPEHADQLDNAREQARQAAIRALNSIYKETFPPAGSGVPTYATVPQIGANGDPGLINGGNPHGTDPTGAEQGPGGSGNPAGPDTTGPQDSAPDPSTPTATQPAGATPSDTTPAGVRPPDGLGNGPGTTTTPAGVGNGPGAPGSPGPTGPGRAEFNPGTPGANPRTGGGPGSSLPGTPGAGTPAGGGNASGVSSAMRPGMGSAGPMAPGAGARRKDGEGEGEHYAPDYLRGVASDWTEGLDTPVEVIGDGGLPASELFASADLVEPTPVRNPQPTMPTAAEVASPEPANSVSDDVASAARTPAADSDGPAARETDSETNPSDAAGFSGAGPSLEDLFADYGWSTDDAPTEPTDPTAAATEDRNSTSRSGADQ